VPHAYNPSSLGGRDQEDMVQGQPEQIVIKILSQKYSTQERADGTAQMVECLASMRP
jgi:hypothetical protein